MSATRPPAYDDRVDAPVEASRRGAHRARPKPASALIPVLAGIAVVLLVAGGIYTVLGRSPDDVSKNTNVSAASTPTASRSGGATASPSAAATATSTVKPSASATPSSAATVDHGIKLVVLNSVPVQGLAKRVQASLQQDGWHVQRTDNSTLRNLATTKVYYGRSAAKVSATALQKDLGFGIVVQDSAVAGTGLVVVLGRDAQ